jgi:hypothetical protein
VGSHGCGQAGGNRILGSVPVLGMLAQQALDHIKIPHL